MGRGEGRGGGGRGGEGREGEGREGEGRGWEGMGGEGRETRGGKGREGEGRGGETRGGETRGEDQLLSPKLCFYAIIMCASLVYYTCSNYNVYPIQLHSLVVFSLHCATLIGTFTQWTQTCYYRKQNVFMYM